MLGVPKSPHLGSRPDIRRQDALVQWAAENLERLRGLSGAELKRKYGFAQDSRVYAFLKAKGVLRDGHLIRKYRWDLMNFELPNGVLQRIWKLPLCRATHYRSEKRLPPSRWTLIRGPAARPRGGEVRAYHRAVQAEERKAAQYLAECGRL